MDYRDYTPLETVTFDTLDKEEKEYHVVVMRGTFDIRKDGILILSKDQEALAATDEYYGKTNQSGVRLESDFAPFKPRTDILIDATAYAPGGRPVSSFIVSVKVTGSSAQSAPPDRPYGLNPDMPPSGEALAAWKKECETYKKNPATEGAMICSKDLLITGPLYFYPAMLGRWTLGSPELMTHLPIRYEHAFGGMITVYNQETEREQTVFYKQNPLGIGHWPEWTHKEARRRKRVPAPRILETSDTLKFGKDLTPQGYGPICRTWQPRLALAGTYDEEWQKGRWPNLPDDFDAGYWNCAHPDLQVPYLNGDEEIHLTNLTPDGNLKITLPGHIPYVLVKYKHNETIDAKANLDTVFIEPDKRKVTLVWRTIVHSDPEVGIMEARMIMRDDDEPLSTEVDHG
jgi:hypothetical protein